MGFGSWEVQPQLSRVEPKTLLASESEEINRALILTLARAIHGTGTFYRLYTRYRYVIQGTGTLYRLCTRYRYVIQAIYMVQVSYTGYIQTILSTCKLHRLYRVQVSYKAYTLYGKVMQAIYTLYRVHVSYISYIQGTGEYCRLCTWYR